MDGDVYHYRLKSFTAQGGKSEFFTELATEVVAVGESLGIADQ